jgi:aspartokinase
MVKAIATMSKTTDRLVALAERSAQASEATPNSCAEQSERHSRFNCRTSGR